MDIDKLAKEFLAKVRPYTPGKPIEQAQRERGTELEIIKLASNENPYAPHKKIKEAVIRALEETNRYPESGAPDLTDALARHHGVGAGEIFVANGTNEILDLLVRIYVKDDENCVFSALSFMIYKIVCTQCGVEGIEVPQRDYTHDLDAMADAINDKTRLVWICNPNNPTATYNNADELERLLARVPDHVLVVLDEAYYEFVDAGDYPDSLALRKQHEGLIVLRTFSKFYSLAGIRLGYAVADPRVVSALNKMRQPFNVNRLAQAAGLAALTVAGDMRWFVEETVRERTKMREALLELGCVCPPSQTNFLFVVPEGYKGDIVKALEDQGVLVRPMAPFGAPANSFRVNTGTPRENARFLEVFGDALAKDR